MPSGHHSRHDSSSSKGKACHQTKPPAEKINKSHVNRSKDNSNCFEGTGGLSRQSKENQEPALWPARTQKETQQHSLTSQSSANNKESSYKLRSLCIHTGQRSETVGVKMERIGANKDLGGGGRWEGCTQMACFPEGWHLGGSHLKGTGVHLWADGIGKSKGIHPPWAPAKAQIILVEELTQSESPLIFMGYYPNHDTINRS